MLDVVGEVELGCESFDIEKSVNMLRLWSGSHQQVNDPLKHDAKVLKSLKNLQVFKER